MHKYGLSLLAMLLVACNTNTAFGFLEFHKVWVDMYVDKEDKSEENQEYVKVVTRGLTRCLVCHQGKKRTNHNPYGIHFVGVIGIDDKKDDEKVREVLEKVGKMTIDPDMDPESEDAVTYNDLIAAKKLPGGPLEELQKEPEEEESDGEQ